MGDQSVTKAEVVAALTPTINALATQIAISTTNLNNISTTTTTETIRTVEEDQLRLLGFVITIILLTCTKNQNM